MWWLRKNIDFTFPNGGVRVLVFTEESIDQEPFEQAMLEVISLQMGIDRDQITVEKEPASRLDEGMLQDIKERGY